MMDVKRKRPRPEVSQMVGQRSSSQKAERLFNEMELEMSIQTLYGSRTITSTVQIIHDAHSND
jgi:hypothetical protein